MVRSLRSLPIGSLVAPVLVLMVVAAALVAVVVLSQRLGGDDAPAKPPAFVQPPASPFTPRDVKQRDGDLLTVIKQLGETAIEEQLVLTAAVKVERLRRITSADVKPGEWVNVIGIPNEVKNFSIHSIVVMDAPATLPKEGFALSAGGFAGYETTRDRRDRPLIGGVVDRVEGTDIILRGPAGDIIVRAGLEAPARLYRLEAVGSDGVQEGDRIAGMFDTGGPPPAILVFPQER